jgi:D-serine deaminase-like pyridoxal phosphate-dependent protein
MPFSPIGQSKWDLDTPALLLDLNKLETNIQRMMSRCQKANLNWRPHTKGSKTPAIAHKLIKAGAIGITCAKLGEAEVMAANGIRDILIANQVVGAQKVARLAHLQHQADVMVAIDHPAHIQTISEAAQAIGVKVRVLVEVDLGMHRCGATPGKSVLELAQMAEAAPGIAFAGIMGYEGHVMALPDSEKEKACQKAMAILAETSDMLAGKGLKVGIVSTGGTGSLAFTPDQAGITEIQAGGGIMMDTYYRDGLHVKGLEHALTILTTVVSASAPDRAVADAGRKTTSSQFSMPEVKDRIGITVTGLSAEHVSFKLDASAKPLHIGDKLELISGYSDMTVFLHDQIYGIRNDKVEAVWDILARNRRD